MNHLKAVLLSYYLLSYVCIRDRFEGGMTQGCVTFRFLTLKMRHFSEKWHFFKIFAAPSAPREFFQLKVDIFTFFHATETYVVSKFSKKEC